MTSTQKTYSTNPNTMKTRALLASNPEYRERCVSKVREYMRQKRSDPAFREVEKPKTREFLRNQYHNNPEAREKKKAAALARYYRIKAEKAAKATETAAKATETATKATETATTLE